MAASLRSILNISRCGRLARLVVRIHLADSDQMTASGTIAVPVRSGRLLPWAAPISFRKQLASLCRRTSQSRAAFRGDEIEDRVFIEHQEGGAAFEGGGSEHQRRAEGTAARFLAQ